MLNVGVAMRFMPSEVAKAVYQCWEDVPSTQEAGSATVCITIHKSSLDKLGEFQWTQPLTPLEASKPNLKRKWAQESRYHLHIHPPASVGNPGSFLSPSPHTLSPGYNLGLPTSLHPLQPLPTLKPPLLSPPYTLSCFHVCS